MVTWGIDPDTQKIAVGLLMGDELVCRTFALDQSPTPQQRLWLATLTLVEGFTALRREFGTPERVMVEQPFAPPPRRPHPQSYYVVGVVQAALCGALGGHAAPVDLEAPQVWRKLALGNGRADKAACIDWILERHGQVFRSADEAEAAGMAYAARERLLMARPG